MWGTTNTEIGLKVYPLGPKKTSKVAGCRRSRRILIQTGLLNVKCDLSTAMFQWSGHGKWKAIGRTVPRYDHMTYETCSCTQ